MALLTGLHVARDSTGNGTAPRGGRLAQGGMLARDTGGIRTGVLFDDGTPVVSGTGTWFLSIRRFAAVGQSTPANGPVVFANDATVGDVEIDPAPGSGSRIDIVYALQPLISADGGSGDSVQPIIEVVSSGASGSPTPPLDQVPAGAVILGSGPVSAGMTSSADVVWTQPQWTVANGGVLPAGGGRFRVWDGSTWRDMAETESGLLAPSAWVTRIRNPGWTRVGEDVSLHGVFRRDDMPWQVGHSVGLGLGSGPRPIEDSSPILRNGDRAVAVKIDTTGTLTIEGIIGSGGLTGTLYLDGANYRTALT